MSEGLKINQPINSQVQKVSPYKNSSCYYKTAYNTPSQLNNNKKNPLLTLFPPKGLVHFSKIINSPQIHAISHKARTLLPTVGQTGWA